MSVRAHRRRRGSRERKFTQGTEEAEAPVVIRHDPAIMLPEKWWWTMANQENDCHDCESTIVVGEVIAWESRRRTMLCTACAFERGVEDQASESVAFRRATGMP